MEARKKVTVLGSVRERLELCRSGFYPRYNIDLLCDCVQELNLSEPCFSGY